MRALFCSPAAGRVQNVPALPPALHSPALSLLPPLRRSPCPRPPPLFRRARLLPLPRAGAAVFLEPRAAGLTKGAGVGYNSCKAGAEAPDTRPEGRRLHPSRLATKASPSPRDGLCASRFFVLGENAPMPCAHTARHKAARGPVLAYSLRLTCRFVSPGRPRAPQCPRGASVPAACTGRHAEPCAAEREFARKRIFGRQGQSGAGRRVPASLSRALQTHK